jgi:hypothetical protein
MTNEHQPSLKRSAFLAAYAELGNITQAPKVARCHRSSHYEWLDDPDYERAFAAAKAEACDHLEAEARRRAVEGVEKPVFYKGVECGRVMCERSEISRLSETRSFLLSSANG